MEYADKNIGTQIFLYIQTKNQQKEKISPKPIVKEYVDKNIGTQIFLYIQNKKSTKKKGLLS